MYLKYMHLLNRKRLYSFLIVLCLTGIVYAVKANTNTVFQNIQNNTWTKVLPQVILPSGYNGQYANRGWTNLIYNSARGTIVGWEGYVEGERYPYTMYANSIWEYNVAANELRLLKVGHWYRDNNNDYQVYPENQTDPTPFDRSPSIAYISDGNYLFTEGGIYTDTPVADANDTWRFNFDTLKWQEISAQNQPDSTSAAWPSTIYLPTIKKIMVFNEPPLDNSYGRGRTWLFDPTTNRYEMLNFDSASEPNLGAGGGNVLAYDAKRNLVWLFGANSSESVYNNGGNELWKFDPQTLKWTKVDITSPWPAKRIYQGFVYIPKYDVFLLHGGRAGYQGAWFSDTWVYFPQQNKWEKLNISGPAVAEGQTEMVYDTVNDVVVMQNEDGWWLFRFAPTSSQLDIINSSPQDSAGADNQSGSTPQNNPSEGQMNDGSSAPADSDNQQNNNVSDKGSQNQPQQPSTDVNQSSDFWSTLKGGEWYEIPNSRLRDIVPSEWNNIGYMGINGIIAWSSGVFDTVRDRLIIWGGGHNDYGGNEIYAFDLADLKWSIIQPQSPYVKPRHDVCNNKYPDGTPVSRHTYDGIEYYPNLDSMFSTAGALFCGAGASTFGTWLYSFQDKKWIDMGDMPKSAWTARQGTTSAYDPVTGNIFVQGLVAFNRYDPRTNSWAKLAEISAGVWYGNRNADIDPEKRLYVEVGEDENAIAWNIDTGKGGYVKLSGPSKIISSLAPGFVWDPVLKKFVGWAGGAELYMLDTDTWTWTEIQPSQTNTVVPPTLPDGVFGRFRYSPKKGVYVVMITPSENVYIYKPKWTEGINQQGSQPASDTAGNNQNNNQNQNNANQDNAQTPSNQKPVGYLDLASPTSVVGWAYDADLGESPVDVEIYVNGILQATVKADFPRSDLKGALNGTVRGINHGFNYTLQNLASGSYVVSVFAIDPQTREKVELNNSPQTVIVSGQTTQPENNTPDTPKDLSVPLLIQEALPDDVTKDGFQLIAGVDRKDEPVRFGLPLPPNSGITTPDQLAVKGASAYQFRALKRWPNGNIEWVLIDAITSVNANQQNKNLALTTGTGNNPKENLAQDKGDYIVVNTGPAQFTIKKKGFNLFDRVVADGREIVSSGSSDGIVLTETDGTEFLALNDSGVMVKIEENGPVRTVIVAKGTHYSADGKRNLDYTVRMHFYRGKTRAKVIYTLRNANKYQLENAVFKKLELKVKTNIAKPSYRIATHNGEITGNLESGKVFLFQGENSYPTVRQYDFSENVWPTTISGYTIKKNGQIIASGNRDEYIDLLYAQAQGNGAYVTFGTRFGAGWWPQGLTIESDGTVNVGLFPDENNKDYAVRFDSHTTREVMFDFGTQEKNARDEFFKFQYPLVGKAQDINWYNNSGAIWEKLVTFQQEYEFQKKNGWNIPLHSSYATPNRRPEMKIYRHKYWGEGGGLNQYDFAKIGAFNFLRQEELFGGGYWLYADQRFLYNADWAVYHSDNYDASNILKEVPNLAGRWGGVNDHFDLPNADKVPKYGLFDGGHRHAYGLSLWYYLTGDERIRETYIDWGEFVKGEKGWVNYTRPFAWAIYNLVDLYRFTGDESYRQTAWQWFKENMLDTPMTKDRWWGMNWARGFYGAQETWSSKSDRSNAPFILGSMYPRSLSYLYDYVAKTNLERDRVRDVLDGITGFIMNEMWYEYSQKVGDYGFPYRISPDQVPPLDVRQLDEWYSGTNMAFLSIVHRYILTGDPEYLRRGKMILRTHTETYPYWSQDYPSRHLLQMLVENPSAFPVWKEMDIKAVKNSDGTYSLSWTVPDGAKEYWIKYSDKPIVPWLNFDVYKRTYEYPPDKYTPFFAAQNIDNEPSPAPAGSIQTMKVAGLDPDKTYYFAAKYYIPGQTVTIPDAPSSPSTGNTLNDNQTTQPDSTPLNNQSGVQQGNADSGTQTAPENTPQGRILKVGPSRQYKVPSEAAKVAKDGDVIEIDAGVYENDVTVWYANNITIKGVGNGRPHMKITNGANAEGKAIWVIKGDNVIVDNIEFSGARVPDQNGAGIRAEGRNLTIRNSYFHDNEVGILGPNNGGDLIIEYSVFEDNYRRANDEGAHMHNMYILNADRFILRYSYVTGTMIGHNVKSRAKENYILYNRIMDEADGGASYQIDIPNGGTTYIIGNIIHQSPLNDNRTIISYGAEGISNQGKDVYVVNNTIVNDDSSGTFVRIYSPGYGKVYNNLFIGPGTLVSGNADQKGNVRGSAEDLMNKDKYDYRLKSTSPAVDAGINPGMANNYILTPVWEYVHPAGKRKRTIQGTIDVGAYEYGEKREEVSSGERQSPNPQNQTPQDKPSDSAPESSVPETPSPSTSQPQKQPVASKPAPSPSSSPVSGGGSIPAGPPAKALPPQQKSSVPAYLPPQTVIDEKQAPLPFVGSSSPGSQKAVERLREKIEKVLADSSVSPDRKKVYERLLKFRKMYKDREVETLERERQRLTQPDERLIDRLKGRILLQVEERGEAWYVDPVTEKRYYLSDGDSAFSLLQIFGLGIRNDDLSKIPVGIEKRAEKIDTDGDGLDDQLEEALGTDKRNPDSDGDGFSDAVEIENGYSPLGQGRLSYDLSLASRLEGRILLQVESRGEAWYVFNGKRYYMKNGRLAYQIMRYLSLGITNKDLSKIPLGE